MNTHLKKIGFSAFLVVMMLTSILIGSAISGAASSVEDHTLTVTIPADGNFGTVQLTIGSGSSAQTEVLESGKAYSITSGVDYKLQAIPNTGYEAVWSNLTPSAGTPQLEGAINSDISYEVRFQPKDYQIHYVDENLYAFDVENTSQVPRKHTYKSNVTIPNVIRSGYEMTGWILYYSDPSQGNTSGIVCEKNYTASFQPSDIWLKPMWQGDEYCVIRLDCWYKERVPYTNGGYLGYQILSGEMGTYADGSMGEDTVYSGYTYFDSYAYADHQTKISISEPYTADGIQRIVDKIAEIQAKPELAGYNIVFRYYLPNQYRIEVDLNADDDSVTYENGETMPNTHVYNENTSIPNPVRAGYNFSYWLVTVNGIAQPNAYPGHTIVQESVEGDIFLKAVWEPKKFSVTYDWNGKSDADNAAIALLNGTLLNKYSTYTYGVLSEFPYPIRTGYIFTGWLVTQNGETVYDEPIKELPEELFRRLPMGFTLTAQWVPATYTVTLNGNGADGSTVPTLSVQYDSALDTSSVQIPVRFGYSFLGYFTDPIAGDQYIDENGASLCSVWTLAEDTVLYAHWEELPRVAVPSFLIDYVNEVFYCPDEKIPVGHYVFSVGETIMDVVVTETTITVDGHIIARMNQLAIPDAFIGQTVQLKVFGDGVTTSHSYVSLTINARPKAPTGVSENSDVISIIAKYTEITVKMKTSGDGFVYEFAISKSATEQNPVWQDSAVFSNLKQGTVYYVYVRVKASEGAYPPGAVFVSEKVYTLYQSYVDEKKDELDALRESTDGEMVDRIIKEAKANISLLEPSADFVDTIEQILAKAKQDVIFARKQDTKLSALQTILRDMQNSGAYSQESLQILQTLYDTAAEGIRSASNTDDINEIYEQAHQAMYSIRITYLFNGDTEMTAHQGVSNGVLMSLIRLSDLNDLNISFGNALKLGKVSVNGATMTLEEALKELRAKDLFAAYSIQLLNGSIVWNDYEGSFTLRLLLPQDLRNTEGLRVAFYNDKTGQLELLETVLNGNILEFRTDSLGSFLILGDPTMDLTNLLWAMGAVLLLQIIAIALLLFRRKKATERLQSVYAAFAVSGFGLTIRIAPDYALTAIVIFGVLILLFQIFLIYLLLSSDLVLRRKQKKASSPTERYSYADAEPVRREDLPETSDEPISSELEEEPVLHSLTDADVGSSEEDVTEDYRGQNGFFEESDGTFDEFADEAMTDVFSEETEPVTEISEDPQPEYGYQENGQAYLQEEPNLSDEADAFEEVETFDEIDSDETEAFSEELGEDESIDGASYYGIDEDSFIEPAADPQYSLPEEEGPYSESSEDTHSFDVFDEEPAQGDSVDSIFESDDEEDLAMGEAYYDEPVPFDMEEGKH